jgi:hypothetical protein
MEMYRPKYVLELGPGVYSTPIFLEYDSLYNCIENDAVWIDYLKEKYGIDVIHHDLGNISADITFDELSFEQKKRIIMYYSAIKIPQKHPRLLFVDQYCACRMLSINTLRGEFDIIIYHDSEIKVNRYDKVMTNGFIRYQLTTDRNSTVLMTKINRPEIEILIIPFIETFMREYPDCTRMIFELL